MQQVNTVSSRATGEITGWFERTRTRLFGQRDRVESQLHDIARQGSAGARVSHWFAGGLIILFSLASLVALGADALVAVQQGLARGRLDVPSAIALGVTALLVPAMDVAMLQAASVIRILATRRAETREMRLHIAVVIGVSVVEAGTYCYMSYRYEHPADAIAWVLIAARALAAPLLSVYLAMARPQPVTSRDILAQVELGAGQGVIRDVTNIANDPTAPLDRKMELFAASAIMRETEAARLERLIAVAQHNTQRALPSARVFGAALMQPEPQTTIHHQYHAPPNYTAMHGEASDYPITDEVSESGDEADDEDWEDTDPGITAKYSVEELREEIAAATSGARKSGRSAVHSGPKGTTSGRDSRAEAISKGMKRSHKQRKEEAQQGRKRLIKELLFEILNSHEASGMPAKLTAAELADDVFALADGRLIVRPSEGTINILVEEWQQRNARAQRRAAAEQTMVSLSGSDVVEPMEPDELRELQEALA